MAQQTTLDFSNAIAPRNPTKHTEPPPTCTEPGPPAKRTKTSRLPPPPEYSVCSPDTPSLSGRELKQYVETIASTRTQPIPFEEYLCKRLSAEHLEWYRTLLSLRINSDERYPIEFDRLWPMCGYSRKDPAVRALEKTQEKTPGKSPGYTNLHPPVEVNSRRGPDSTAYKLTIECAETFAARAPVGLSVTLFFIRLHAVTEEYMLIDSEIRGKRGILDEVHKTLVDEYRGKDIVYLGFVQHLNSAEDVYSMGHCRDIADRFQQHRKKYGNFHLVYAKKAPYKARAEQAIFHHPLVAPMRDQSIMEGDRELFRVLNTEGALTSLKNTIDKVTDEVCVEQGTVLHVTERQTPKSPEELAHEIRLREMDERQTADKWAHEVLMQDRKCQHEIHLMEMKMELASLRRRTPAVLPDSVEELDPIEKWWNENTEPANAHITSKTLMENWNAYSKRKDNVTQFNKLLRSKGIIVKRSVRIGPNVATGVENRKLKEANDQSDTEEIELLEM